MPLNILCIGDVVGRPGRRMLADHLGDLVAAHNVDFVVCNAENAAGGSGLTGAMFQKLLHYGVDVVTLGDHVYRKREITSTLESSPRIVRPANISPKAIGRRWTLAPTKDGRCEIAVACVLGQMYMGSFDSPWRAIDEILAEVPPAVTIRVLDFHAEASSEKIAMGWHCDGRASVVFGTHTHVPTADARLLEKGTAYISDVGMTGPYDSVLGRRKDRVLWAMTTSMPTPFDVATGDPRIQAVLVSVNEDTGRATDIRRLEVCGYKETSESSSDDDDGD